MRRVVFWLLLLALALALVIIISPNPDRALANLGAHDFASLLVKIGALVLIGGAVLALFRDRFSQAIQFTLIWAVIGLLLALGYTYRLELRDVYERVAAELVPGRAITRGQTFELVRG